MTDPTATLTSIRTDFLIDEDLAFLNHGSFGAIPRPVLEHYHDLQKRFESSPVEFYARRTPEMMRDARIPLAALIGADHSDLAWVTNATIGIHYVLRSLELGPGDEIVTTDHEYGACERLLKYLSARQGFRVTVVEVPLPFDDPDLLVDRIRTTMGPETRLLFFSHITSPTALTLPAAELCLAAREKGVLSLVDGAHAPAQIELDLNRLGSDFYVGNLHKWLCAPKGSAFLHARAERKDLIEPLIVSWGWEPVERFDNPFADLVQMRGTRDIAAPISVPAAIDYQRENDWDERRAWCREQVSDTRQEIADLLGGQLLTRDHYEQMTAILLPESIDAAALQKYLFERHRVEVPTFDWHRGSTLRYSIQAYNSPQDIERLKQGILGWRNRETAAD